MEFKEFRKLFDTHLQERIRKEFALYGDVVGSDSISRYFDYVVAYMQGGKRVRPYVIYLTYSLFKDDMGNGVWDAMMAVEIVHVMALIHDDIVDASSKRRGIDSMHVHIEKQNAAIRSDAAHHGVSQAILIGDVLLAFATKIVRESVYNVSVSDKFYELLYSVILGEMLDVELSGVRRVSKEKIIKKTLLKSGKYTFQHPMEIGALLADASPDILQHISLIGEKLGLVFQVQDDLLDCIADEETLGKPRFGDIKEAQQTLITDYVFTHASQEDKSEFESYLGSSYFSAADQRAISDMLERTGAVEYLRTQIQELFSEIRGLVENMDDVSEQGKKDFMVFIEMLEKRNS